MVAFSDHSLPADFSRVLRSISEKSRQGLYFERSYKFSSIMTLRSVASYEVSSCAPTTQQTCLPSRANPMGFGFVGGIICAVLDIAFLLRFA